MKISRSVTLPKVVTVLMYGWCLTGIGCSDHSGNRNTHRSAVATHGEQNLRHQPADTGSGTSDSSITGNHRKGKRLFTAYCLACHGGDGHGSHAAPPLVGSPWAAGPPSRVVRIILHGVRGPIEVGGGSTFNREMPGFGRALTDARIAEIVTYVRNAFGKSAGAVAPEDVAEIRSETRDRSSYWTAEELLAVP